MFRLNAIYHFWKPKSILKFIRPYSNIETLPWMHVNYSIVKDSSADLGVNFKIVQKRPTIKAVCTKILFFFFAYLSIFLYFWEKIKRYHFSYFEYLSKNSPKLNQNYYWLWVYFGLSVSNGQIRITVLNYTVDQTENTFRDSRTFSSDLSRFCRSLFCIHFKVIAKFYVVLRNHEQRTPEKRLQPSIHVLNILVFLAKTKF